MGKILKWTGIGCGGLLVLVILLGILGALLSGGNSSDSNDTASSSSENSSSSSQASSDQKKANSRSGESTVAINQPLKVADATWVVTSAEDQNQLQDEFGVQPPKQGNFVVVNFTFTNDGTEAKNLSQNIINLYDSSDRKSSPDTDTLFYIPNEKNIFLNQVNPGVTKDGEVIFSVAPDASGFKLELANTNYLKSDKGYVDLGF